MCLGRLKLGGEVGRGGKRVETRGLTSWLERQLPWRLTEAGHVRK